MTQFMLVYRGAATDLTAMTPEEGKAVLDRWQGWMGKVGSALKDVGAPFGESTSLVDNGKTATASSSGYSIIEANDLNDGKFAIDIFELAEIPGM